MTKINPTQEEIRTLSKGQRFAMKGFPGRSARSRRDAEQEKFENLSEGLQQSEKGQAIEQAAPSLGEAVDSLDSAISEADSAISTLEGIE